MRSRSLQGLVPLSAQLQASCRGEGPQGLQDGAEFELCGLERIPTRDIASNSKSCHHWSCDLCDIAARMRKAGDEAKAYGSVATAMTMGMVLFACCMG